MIAVNWPRAKAHDDGVERDDAGVARAVDLGQADGAAPPGRSRLAAVAVLVTKDSS